MLKFFSKKLFLPNQKNIVKENSEYLGIFHLLPILLLHTVGSALRTPYLRATSDEGPRSNKVEQSYWLRAINWTHELLNEGPRPKKRGKSRLNLYGTILERKIN
jgi:hypothetical protein